MVKIGIFAIAAAFTAIILSSIPASSFMNEESNDEILSNGAGKVYLDDPKNREKLGLPVDRPVKWSYATSEKSIGYTQWNNKNAFVKCVESSNDAIEETKAFEILIRLINHPKYNIPGKHNIMHPLKRFNVPHPNFPKETKDNCFIYTRAPGATLKEFIIDKTWQQKAQYLPQIFYQVTQGMLYLRRVGIIHYDIDHENVMVHVNTKNNMVQATIIDYDCVSFIYGSIQKTLELAPYTNLDMINGHDQKRYCNIGNSLFSTTIHFAITEAVIIDEFDDIVQGSFEMISGIFDATAKGLSVSPDKRYGVVYDRKPQYPSKMDEPYAKVLYPLVKAMKKLYDSSYGCAIPNDVLALLGFANMK